MTIIIYLIITITLFLWSLSQIKRRKSWFALSVISYLVFFAVLFTWYPLPNTYKERAISPTQVIYRFDEHRSLQLRGYHCQGALYYIDEKEQIYTLIAPHSVRILTEPFTHAAGSYIYYPYDDYSGSECSYDGGRTFGCSITLHTMFFDKNYIDRKEVIETRVVGNRLYVQTNKEGNRLYATPKPFGPGGTLMWPEELAQEQGRAPRMYPPSTQFRTDYTYMGARWDDFPTTIPELPADFKGWDRSKCDWDATDTLITHDDYAPIKELQQKLKQWLGITLLQEFLG